jgi:hypothetical protein
MVLSMTDVKIEEEIAPKRAPTTKTALCPECDWVQEPMAYGAQWRKLYEHARAEHAWTAEQVEAHKEARGVIKPDAVSKPSPKGRVDRGRKQRASSGTEAAEAATSIGPKSFQKKLVESQKVAKVILEQVNPVMLGTAPMFLGIPKEIFLDARIGPVVIKTICFNEGEAMLFGAAAVFGDSEWMAKMLEKILPPALSLIAGAVLVAHGYNVLKLRGEIAAAIKQQAPPAYANGSAPPEPAVDMS